MTNFALTPGISRRPLKACVMHIVKPVSISLSVVLLEMGIDCRSLINNATLSCALSGRHREV